MRKLRVGIVGATGNVGRVYFALLKDHPYFELTYVAGSKKSISKPFHGFLLEDPFCIKTLKNKTDLVFSALPSDAAELLEKLYARASIPLFSNSSFYRMDEKTELVIPEINGEKILNTSNKSPFIVKPNCAMQNLAIPLYPLHRAFSLQSLHITSLQSVSGAGSALRAGAIMDNVIPFIPKEEEKIIEETQKILGTFCPIFCKAIRIPTSNGHIASISASFEKDFSKKDIIDLWESFEGIPQKWDLPSAPKRPVHFIPEIDRPQLSLDRDKEKGMAVSVGGLQVNAKNHLRFTALSHNLIRGAAGGAILSAEIFYQGVFSKKEMSSFTRSSE